jgi:DNA-binding transcriptional LysR family regulator
VGVSQPAASLLLRELETVFDAPLVVRTAKGCRLSPAGADALHRLTIALASVDAAIEASRARAGGPVLRMGAVQLAGTTILPAALARVDLRGTPARISVREGRASELLHDLARGALDCVIGWVDEATVDRLPVDDFRLTELFRARMRPAAAADHPLALKRNVTLSDLLAWGWIVAHEGTRTHAAFMRFFANAGVAAPLPVIECSAVHTTLNLVAHTRNLAMVPDVLALAYARQGSVKVLRGRDLLTEESSISFIVRRDSTSLPLLQRFQQALIASVKASV